MPIRDFDLLAGIKVVFFRVHSLFFVITCLHIGKNYVIHVYKNVDLFSSGKR